MLSWVWRVACSGRMGSRSGRTHCKCKRARNCQISFAEEDLSDEPWDIEPDTSGPRSCTDSGLEAGEIAALSGLVGRLDRSGGGPEQAEMNIARKMLRVG